MFKQQHYLALGAVTLVAVVVLSLPSRVVSPLKLAIGSLFLPLFGLVNAAHQLPARAADALMPRGELLKQIETLRRENEELKARQLQADTSRAKTTNSVRTSAGSNDSRGNSNWPGSSCATRPTGGAPCRLTWAAATASPTTCRC